MPRSRLVTVSHGKESVTWDLWRCAGLAKESQPCWNPAGLRESRFISISTSAEEGGRGRCTEKGQTEYGTFI